MSGLRVSVVIPTYNRAHLIARAVQSALSAIAPGDEILVVDDGSTDRTAEALVPFQGRIRYLPGPHAGAGITRNRGVAAAQGDLIAFLDSDDEWLPEHLTLHRAVHAARPEIRMSFSDLISIDRNGTRIRNYLKFWHRDPRPWTDILGPAETLAGVPVHIGDMRLPQLLSYYVATFTMVARRDALPDQRWFADDVPTYEDLQCFGRLAFAGPAAYLDHETAIQHGHADARLTDAPTRRKAESCIRILERIWGQNVEFVRQFQAEYSRRLGGQYTLLARCLIKEGRTVEARAALANAGPGLWLYRLWAYLPGPVALALDRGWLATKQLVFGPPKN